MKEIIFKTARRTIMAASVCFALLGAVGSYMGGRDAEMATTVFMMVVFFGLTYAAGYEKGREDERQGAPE